MHGLRPLLASQLLLVTTLLPASALAQTSSIVLECPTVGLGGDSANTRGIRFTVDASFSSVLIHMDSSTAGIFTFDAELRRSSGYTAPVESFVSMLANLPGTPQSTPFPAVQLNFPQLIGVSGGPEIFTLKLTNIVGPGALYLEVAGIGNIPCPDAEVTNENNVAMPTQRTSACGFQAIGPVALNNYCDSLPNSTGLASSISTTGSFSHVANNLGFAAGPMAPGQPGIFYYGPDQIQVIFGDGNRCVGGSVGTIVRIFPFAVADTTGTMSAALDNTLPAHAQVQPGVTLNFQAWFRDPAAGMSGFNLSDGIEVTFTP